jgi:hypothetical protein
MSAGKTRDGIKRQQPASTPPVNNLKILLGVLIIREGSLFVVEILVVFIPETLIFRPCSFIREQSLKLKAGAVEARTFYRSLSQKWFFDLYNICKTGH